MGKVRATMCGICGVVDSRGEGRVREADVRAMCAAIEHRGPDGDGFFTDDDVSIGMRRLSIIDVQGSDQPLFSADRSLALVFNGEIYNYRELRDDLRRAGYAFYTDGDGETLIHLYEHYGLDLFQHLRGMYAFALWDRTHNRLLLAVDHIGMKPLYLYEREGVLHFASEIKALLTSADIDAHLNLDALDTYLTFGFQVGEDTLFSGIRRLPPGHWIVVEDGTIRQGEFWSFVKQADAQTPPQSESEIIATTRDLLRESVRLHLRSDVPLGLFLSGGVDSAAMLALMALEDTATIKTFTVGYEGSTRDNESAQARRVAQHFQTDHHERTITAADWWDGLQHYVYHEDEPTANPSAVSLMLLAEETAKHVKVVLTGLGGDELFGGYPHHRNIPALLKRQAQFGTALAPFADLLGALEPYYPAFKRYRIIGALPTYLPELRRIALPRDDALLRAFSFDGMVWSDALRERLYGPQLAQRQDHKREVYSAIIESSWCDDPRDSAAALVANTWLHGNALLHMDKVTMAHSLEGRIPLFDPDLIAYAVKIPAEIRLKANKYVLREALRPHLPAFALERPKQPFSTPIRGWFERDLRDPIRAVLLDTGAKTRGLFQQRELETLLDNHFSGREKQEEIMFRLLNLELWAQRFGVGGF